LQEWDVDGTGSEVHQYCGINAVAPLSTTTM